MPPTLKTLTRRSALKGACGLSALSIFPSILAADESPRKVWLDMTQEELDAAYSQGPWAPNMNEIWKRYSTNSDLARSRIGEPVTMSYGASDDETLDLYKANASAAPVHVFVHGGAWFTGNSRDHGFLAETFVNAGAHFIAINYSSVDDTDKRLIPLAEQVKRAVAWVYGNADELNADPRKIYLSGHSSGAHLAGVAMTTDWRRDFDLPPNIINGGLLCSGMFDLEPVSLSDRNEYVRFDEETISSLSPQRHIARLMAPVIITYGSLESPEFQRQSRDFAQEIREQGKQVDVLIAENYNHFEILETLANPYGLLGTAALGQMNLI